MTDSVDPTSLVHAFVRAINSQDIDAAVDLFVPRGFIDDWGAVFRGHAEIRRWMTTDAIGADARMTILDSSLDGNVVAVRFAWVSRVFTGRSTGMFTVIGDRLSSFTISSEN
ncbi:hypothetical protein NS183_13610 [Microbacterium testaceum]|uniref:nuclear transport factor 2 family protein n=1 Tax=Microbacterium testaceum TaxID=2033 RepID=UPI000734BD3D|nr:nuclear transport factor 2 family protein [Microbacterium testaceum]KTS84946.1 hypothetical protein NS183_13610 [Microbacterium testaceum]